MVLLRTKATAGSSLVAYKSLNCLSFFQFASERLGVQIGHFLRTGLALDSRLVFGTS